MTKAARHKLTLAPTLALTLALTLTLALALTLTLTLTLTLALALTLPLTLTLTRLRATRACSDSARHVPCVRCVTRRRGGARAVRCCGAWRRRGRWRR